MHFTLIGYDFTRLRLNICSSRVKGKKVHNDTDIEVSKMRFSLNLIQQGTKIISNTHEWFSTQYDTQFTKKI